MTAEHWHGRDCLVAGGGGFIGAALATELHRRGATVTLVARRASPRVNALRSQIGCHVLLGDLTDMDTCRSAVRGRDDVFMAAAADGNSTFKRERAAYIYYSNTAITSNLFEACREARVASVTYISSADVYADTPDGPLSEDVALGDVRSPRFTSYALAKIFGEMAARVFHQEYGMPIAVVRPCNIYGPGDWSDETRSRVVSQWVRAALAGEPIRVWGTGEEERSFLYVDDLVDGLLLTTQRYACAEPVNLTSSESVNLRGLAELVRSAAGVIVPIEVMPDRPAGPLRRVVDGRLASEVLGFSPQTPLAVGIAATVQATRVQLAASAAEATTLGAIPATSGTE
jgi:nucleoside-diphosphate-sugar epimerase